MGLVSSWIPALKRVKYTAHLSPFLQVRKLKDLREMLLTRDPDVCVTIKKIGMVSLMEIFKDIIPSYRIREVSEQEKKQQVRITAVNIEF